MNSHTYALACCAAFLVASPVLASEIGECGDWARIASPNQGEIATFLRGVSGVADDDVWAVGWFRVPQTRWEDDELPFSMHWDGDQWNQVTVPVPPGGNDDQVRLYDVTAVAHDDVWAVGNYIPPGHVNTIETLSLHWDGSDWQQESSPVARVGRGSTFYAIDSRDGEIWAAGYSLGSGNRDFLAARWNGSSWDEYFPERINNGENRLTSIDIVTEDEVWAAGNIGPLALPYVTRWDGSSWEVVEPLIDKDLYLGLTSIIAFAEDDVWVGASRVVDYVFEYFVYLHFDGTSWTEFPTVHEYHLPNFEGDESDNFYSGGYGTLARYDGTEWSLVDSLAVDVWTISNIDVLPTGTVWGVGNTYDTEIPVTLTAHFDPCGVVGVSSPSIGAGVSNLPAPWPNPMSQRTEFQFDLADEADVRIDVFTAAGQHVRELIRTRLDAGPHRITWDGRDHSGAEVESGIYFYRAIVGEEQLSRRVVVLRR